MFKLIKIAFFSILASAFMTHPGVADSNRYNIGTSATVDQISGWDIDVRPDGTGLPDGAGNVMDGEILYEEKCASCHGSFGEGMDRWPILAGGMDSLTEDRPEKTIGSYWPYVSTLWDYIHRAMPFLQPQSLTDDEVYAVTAYVLYLNDLVEDDFELSKSNFTTIKLTNEMAFVDDPRPDVNNKRCMQDCRDPASIKITWDSTDLGVTPTEHLQSDQISVSSSSDIGADIYQSTCSVCHDQGVAGAPKTGDTQQWTLRLQKGLDTLTENAINGYQGENGFMPAKGGNPNITDDEVKAAVEYMNSLVN